ncbi:MAG: flagellar motor protein MotB, partial [Gammaproteobacteria bacterium]
RDAVRRLAELLQGMELERVQIIGHADAWPLQPGEDYLSNTELSRARAEAVAALLTTSLALQPGQVQIVGRGAREPWKDNDTEANRRLNRRVEIAVTARRSVQAAACGTALKAYAHLRQADQRARTPVAHLDLPCAAGQATQGQAQQLNLTPPRASADPRRAARPVLIQDDVTAAGGNRDWLAGLGPEPQWLFPPADHNPRAPAVRVAIQHGPQERVELRLNAEPVHALNFDGSRGNADQSAAVSLWRGVDLREGENRLEARILDADGRVLKTLRRSVHYANTPVRAELVAEQSRLVADGRSRPLLAVRLLDRDGRPVRAGVALSYSIPSGQRPAQLLEFQQRRALAGSDRFQPSAQVEGDEGIAYIELEPTTESGAVVLEFRFGESTAVLRRQELRAWLEPRPRDWVVVGFAEGTLGYDTLKGNLQALEERGLEDSVTTDGQTRLYAKGRVRGDWLLTLAYDSDKPRDRQRLENSFPVIDPDEFYTLYGDGAEPRADAPSQGKLYLRLERRRFYALFGDYDSALTETQLARYSRRFNGIKSEYAGSLMRYSLYAAETAQNFGRDELQGDGTSGLYRLSRQGLVLNSERIRIETRDRLRSERIVTSRPLTRYLDYDIDYSAGTLFFREPIPSRDAEFNPVFIVVEYETLGTASEELNAGGRIAFNLGRHLTVGASALREAEYQHRTDLGAVDLRLALPGDTQLRLEAGLSDGMDNGVERSGEAYLAEFEHHGRRLDTLLYARRQAPGFGLNQQNSSELATQKTGVDAQWRLGPELAVQGQAYRQENLASEITRDAAITRLQYRAEHGGLAAGLQAVRDRAADGAAFESQQAMLAANRYFFGKVLELHAQAESALGGSSDSVDFPDRYVAGASYALTDDLRLLLAQEITDGAAFDTQTTRLGMQALPWQGARLNTTLNQSAIRESGPRTYAQMGLTQALLLGERWGVDLAFDSTRSLRETGQTPLVVNPAQPVAPGGTLGAATLTEDFVALSAGLTYRSELWSWNLRAESREGETSDRYGLRSGFLRQARAGVAFASSLQAFFTETGASAEGLSARWDLSWAYRPLDSRYALLNRLEFGYDQIQGGQGTFSPSGTLSAAGDAQSRRVINNFSLNRVSSAWTGEDRRGNLFAYAPRSQWSLYYGAKYVFDRFDDVDYRGYTDLLGLEARHDLSPRFDLGLQASMLTVWQTRTRLYAAGPSLGYTPADNAWVSLGYNLLGFRDRDFDAARYTAQGPYLKLRIKFDQNTRLGAGRSASPPGAAGALP